jgi:hypothetical protein
LPGSRVDAMRAGITSSGLDILFSYSHDHCRTNRNKEELTKTLRRYAARNWRGAMKSPR